MNIDSTSAAGFILRELTWCVRVLTAEQLQRMLNARRGRSVSGRSLTQRLQAEGLVNLVRTAAAFHEATEPIASRSPGQPAPDFGALAWQLEERWRDVLSRRVTICWATSRAARLLGGIAPFERRATQLEHDLGTAGVLVRLRESRPELADQWVGEDILRRDYAPYCSSLKSIPDGALVSGGRILRVIEYGGQYTTKRLHRFDVHFHRKHGIRYEIW